MRQLLQKNLLGFCSLHSFTFLVDSELVFLAGLFNALDFLPELSLLSPPDHRSKYCWTTSAVAGAMGRGVLMLIKLLDLERISHQLDTIFSEVIVGPHT